MDWKVKPVVTVLVLVIQHWYVAFGALKKIGCFKDDSTNRDLSFNATSVEECPQKCAENGYPYAGLQVSTCFCGHKYGRHGPDTGCTTTCGSYHCGTVNKNSIYYTLETNRNDWLMAVQKNPLSFDNARTECVKKKGDLFSALISQTDTDDLAEVAKDETFVWVGLNRHFSGDYVWADASTKYNHTSLLHLWKTPVNTSADCVALDVASKRLVSKACSETLSYVCHVAPQIPTNAPEQNGGGFFSNSTNLTMYVVLPLFVLCFGGSCVIYGGAKMYRSCKRRNKKKVMILQDQENEAFDDVETGNDTKANGPERVSSARTATPIPSAVDDVRPQNLVTPRSPSQISARPMTAASTKLEAPPPYTPYAGQNSNTDESLQTLNVAALSTPSRPHSRTITPTTKAAPIIPVQSPDQQAPRSPEKNVSLKDSAKQVRAEHRRKALLENALREARERRQKERSTLSASDLAESRAQSRNETRESREYGAHSRNEPRESRAYSRSEPRDSYAPSRHEAREHHRESRNESRAMSRSHNNESSLEHREREMTAREVRRQRRLRMALAAAAQRERGEGDQAKLLPPELQFTPASNMEAAEANIKAIEEIVRAKRMMMRQKRRKEKERQSLTADGE